MNAKRKGPPDDIPDAPAHAAARPTAATAPYAADPQARQLVGPQLEMVRARGLPGDDRDCRGLFHYFCVATDHAWIYFFEQEPDSGPQVVGFLSIDLWQILPSPFHG